MVDRGDSGPEMEAEAREILDSYLDLQRLQILDRALRSVEERSTPKYITGRDIARALNFAPDVAPDRATEVAGSDDETRWLEETFRSRRMRTARLALLIRLYGIVLTVGGVIAAVYFQIGDRLQSGTAAAAAIAAAGVILGAVFPYVISQMQQQRSAVMEADLASSSIRIANSYVDSSPVVALDTKKALRYTYLERWAELERTVRLVADQRGLSSTGQRTSLRDTVLALMEADIFYDIDVEKFFDALRMRNNIAHGVYDEEISDDDVKEMLSAVAQLQYHLDSLL